MKRIFLFIAVLACASVCSSCGLLSNTARTAGRLVQSVGRTILH